MGEFNLYYYFSAICAPTYDSNTAVDIIYAQFIPPYRVELMYKIFTWLLIWKPQRPLCLRESHYYICI